MTASKYIVFPILLAVLLLVDSYAWKGVKTAFQNSGSTVYHIVKYLFWTLTAVTLVGLWAYNFVNPDIVGVKIRTLILGLLFVGYASKLVVVLFVLIDDIRRLVQYLFSKKSGAVDSNSAIALDSSIGKPIDRSEFLMKTALLAAAIPAVAMTWGIISGAHDYRIRRIKLKIGDLPRSFEGMTIVQISDIHTGSFFNKTAVKGGIEMILREKADMVFFTGDLVNDRASEVKDYIHLFDKIKAPLGVYSTLGNHDYGVYAGWPSEQARLQSVRDIKEAHRIMGYDLLTDENRLITLGGDTLAIIGVENNSATEPMFQNIGNVANASIGTEDAAVKFLLSHDPTHWDKEVNTKFLDIDVMFSGHTHGLQFGVDIGGKTYTPAQMSYKQWGGLYKEGQQQLYVNRGFGYMGYPGRVGMPPEITVFQLGRA